MTDRRFSLASLSGLAVVVTLLAGSGAMCPKCGHGTRVTSKRWAKCKKCGERVARRPMDEVAGELKQKLEPPSPTKSDG
jgi:tRNA(Ile2) C34 agmatinyltransferase TiaS